MTVRYTSDGIDRHLGRTAPAAALRGRSGPGPGTARKRLHVAVLGSAVPTPLSGSIASAPGFDAPLLVERPSRLKGFRGAAVVIHSAAPHRTVTATLNGTLDCPPILVLTNVPDTALAIETLRRGATSYLIAGECSRDEFLFSLRGTAEGHSSMSPSITTALVQRIHQQGTRSPDAEPAHPLTPRDLAVLTLVADGCTNTQIATRLGLAEKTVRNAVSQLYGKIHVGSRAEAIVWGIRRRAV
jgi:DNA-binding NarL/FixJ family response regulator